MSFAEKKITLRPCGPPRKLARPDGFKTASISVGLNGEVSRLLVAEQLADALVARIEAGFASFPRTHIGGEYSAILAVDGPSASRKAHLSGLTATFPKVEMLPNKEALVVAPRCHRNRDGTHELNARVYDADGKEKGEFLLGDGIERVQADAEGNIWVGYSDEGVYGNFGWQRDGVRFGAAGLSCFSAAGRKTWDFQPPKGFDYISDCYALNVSKSGTWAYYYSGFPIVFIDPSRRIRAWQTESTGGRTFAVGNERVLLYGGYNERRTACSLLDLGKGTAKQVAEVSLVLPQEAELSKATVIGRDKELHVFCDDDWFVFSIGALG